jgi:uncharacterized protein YecT (DUF1311 family)
VFFLVSNNQIDMTKQPYGPPMTLGNMRHLSVQHLVATCLNDACRHQGPYRRVELSATKGQRGDSSMKSKLKSLIIAVALVSAAATATNAEPDSIDASATYNAGTYGEIAAFAMRDNWELVKPCHGSDVACLKRAYNEADKILNQAYQGIIQNWGCAPNDTGKAVCEHTAKARAGLEKLRGLQRAWVSWREQNCKFMSVDQETYLDCMTWATVERSHELHTRLGY